MNKILFTRKGYKRTHKNASQFIKRLQKRMRKKCIISVRNAETSLS